MVDKVARTDQVRRVWYLANQGHYPREELRRYLQRRYGTSEPSQLTGAQADEVIRKLRLGEDIA